MKIILRFLRQYAVKHWPSYVVGLIMLGLTNNALIQITQLAGDAVTRLGEGGPQALKDSQDLALELGFWAFTVVIVRTLSRVMFFNPGREVEYRLGVNLFSHLLMLQRPFFGRNKVGDLLSLATNDTQSVRLFVGFASLQVCNVIIFVPMFMYHLIRIDPVLTAWCVTPIFVGGLFMRWTIRRFYTMVRESMEELGKLSERVLETYAGVSTVRAHAVDEPAVSRFEDRNQTYFNLQMKIARVRAFAMPVLGLSGKIGAGVVFWVGGNRVIDGHLQIGDLATFSMQMLNLVSIFLSLGWVLAAIPRGIVALDRVNRVMDTDPQLPVVTEGIELGERPPRLELRGVNFSYPDADRLALTGVDAIVEPGHTLGIFGHSGSGKSTLIDLLARVHTPPEGSVMFDGKDIRSFDIRELRENLAVVSQEPFLFSTTLRENVRLKGEASGHELTNDAQTVEPTFFERLFGDKHRDSETMNHSAPDANLDRVICAACMETDIKQLPQGLDTVIGERGVMLSGGQRQRTALARALYREPTVLLLDDILSAVDQSTEAKLVDSIRSLRAGTSGQLPPTTIIVSHRTSVLEHADEIIVLTEGKVVERGKHSELIHAGGVYAAAHAHQADEGTQGERA